MTCLGALGWVGGVEGNVCDPVPLFKSANSVLYVFLGGWGGNWVGSEGCRKLQKALVAAAIGLLCGLLNSSFGMSIGVECICLSWAAAMCCGSEQGCTTHGVSGGAKSTFLQPHNR